MEDLAETVDVLSEIKHVSTTILTNMVEIMEKISKDEDNDIIEEIVARTDLGTAEVLDFVQDFTMEMVSDADNVSSEIDPFVAHLRQGEAALEAHMGDYVFLAKVWYGDIYDEETALDGLKKLRDDMKDTLKRADEGWIIEHSVKSLAVGA